MKLKQRLEKIEMNRKSAPPTKEQAARQLDELLAQHGHTRETASAQYGSVEAFCYALMLKSDGKPRPEPTDGLTAQERYFKTLKE